MTKTKYLMISSLVIVLSAFLIYFSGIFNQTELADPLDAEPDLSEEAETPDQDEAEADTDEEQDLDQEQTDGTASQPNPGSTFEHKAEIKVNGVIEKDKGSRWWEEGFDKKSGLD